MIIQVTFFPIRSGLPHIISCRPIEIKMGRLQIHFTPKVPGILAASPDKKKRYFVLSDFPAELECREGDLRRSEKHSVMVWQITETSEADDRSWPRRWDAISTVKVDQNRPNVTRLHVHDLHRWNHANIEGKVHIFFYQNPETLHRNVSSNTTNCVLNL